MPVSDACDCPCFNLCGGCAYPESDAAYKEKKENQVKRILKPLAGDAPWRESYFVPTGSRRRAAFAFRKNKAGITLGFNEKSGPRVISFEKCRMLSPKINKLLPDLENLLKDLCQVKICQGKGKKMSTRQLEQGDIKICLAHNGIDAVMAAPLEPNLEMREIIAEHLFRLDDIIRFSWQKDENSPAETILEKNKPYLLINGYSVYIPAGTFLQPSAEGEAFLRRKTKEYLQGIEGKIADLFCGVGTFSYELCREKNIKIIAADSSAPLLEGFKNSLNKNQISNVETLCRNLFKYPLKEELEGCAAMVIDPPRAGADRQIREICNLRDKPERIVMISCNPHSLLKDGELLKNSGYSLKEMTFLDQFAYSNHSEVIALFTK